MLGFLHNRDFLGNKNYLMSDFEEDEVFDDEIYEDDDGEEDYYGSVYDDDDYQSPDLDYEEE